MNDRRRAYVVESFIYLPITKLKRYRMSLVDYSIEQATIVPGTIAGKDNFKRVPKPDPEIIKAFTDRLNEHVEQTRGAHA